MMAKVVGMRQRVPRTYECELVVSPGGPRPRQENSWSMSSSETFIVLSWEGTVLSGAATKADLAHVRCSVCCVGGEALELAADLITPADAVAAARIDRIEKMLAYLLKDAPPTSAPSFDDTWWREVKEMDLVVGMRRLGWTDGSWGIDYRKLLTPILVGARHDLQLVVDTTSLRPEADFGFRLTAFGLQSRDVL